MQKRSSYDNKPLHCISGYVCGFEDTAEGGAVPLLRSVRMGRLLFKHSKRFKKQPALFNCVEAALSGSLLGRTGYLKAETECVRDAHTLHRRTTLALYTYCKCP